MPATRDGGAPLGYTGDMLLDKQIILGVSGSIAAYKAVYLTRLLQQQRAGVWPILTASGTRFVGPLTFSALTGHGAITDMWAASGGGEISHVELAHRADLLLLAPATADLLARLAAGRADDPLAAVALATHAPWVVSPAMESGMWENAATKQSVESLRQRGATFVEPASGSLASGAVGPGRMAEPETILEAVLNRLTPQDLAGQRVLVTAGPTREALDPVRFISNASSGKMGYALAKIARRRGADVCLISGPSTLTPPPGVQTISVVTTDEMLRACKEQIDDATVLIMAAAPADFQPTHVADSKTPKPKDTFDIELQTTTDILLHLKARTQKRVVVGFAAQTGSLVEKARAKLRQKDLDLVVANDVTRPGAGFAVDTNAVELFDRAGLHTRLPIMAKEEVADAILDRVVEMLRKRS